MSLEGCAEQAPGGPSAADADPLPDAPPAREQRQVPRRALLAALRHPRLRSRRRERLDGHDLRTDQPLRQPGRLRRASTRRAASSKSTTRAAFPTRSSEPSPGSSFDSFIKNEGTGNGSLISPLVTSAMDGFAVNPQEELMMQVTLGTGPDARYVCAGGSKDAPPVLSPIDVQPQTDGVNHSRVVLVAIYCRPSGGCRGGATVSFNGARVGHTSFNLARQQDEPRADPPRAVGHGSRSAAITASRRRSRGVGVTRRSPRRSPSRSSSDAPPAAEPATSQQRTSDGRLRARHARRPPPAPRSSSSTQRSRPGVGRSLGAEPRAEALQLRLVAHPGRAGRRARAPPAASARQALGLLGAEHALAASRATSRAGRGSSTSTPTGPSAASA